MSNSSANPILRRLTGVEGENDISAGERFCNPCFTQHVRLGVCVDIINADAGAFLAKVEDENFHVSRNQILDKLIEMINIARGDQI